MFPVMVLQCRFIPPHSSPLRREVESVEANQMGLIHPTISHSFWPLAGDMGAKGNGWPLALRTRRAASGGCARRRTGRSSLPGQALVPGAAAVAGRLPFVQSFNDLTF